MRKLSFLLTLVGTLILTGCDIQIDGFDNEKFQKDFRFTYPVNASISLNLENMNGSVDIAGWDRNEVEITGVKFARTEVLRDEIRIDIQHSDTSVSIRTVAPYASNGGIGARYVIRVPRKATLDHITTSNGKVHVSDVEGSVRLKSSNASIQISQVKGNAEAQTSNGSVEAIGVDGSAHLHTSNSHVSAEGIKGPVDATSSNGSITITLNAGAKDVQARTSNSSITVKMPAEAAARIRASTSNGHISSAFNQEGTQRDERRHLEGTINNGSSSSPLLDLTTSNGSIRIEKL